MHYVLLSYSLCGLDEKREKWSFFKAWNRAGGSVF